MNTKIIFLFFSIILFISSISLIVLQNSVHSVICLVLSFLASSGILVLLESEFFAFLFIIVYVGAIAILFLFVVMMLDIKNLEINQTKNVKYYIFGVFLAFSLLFLTLSTSVNYYKTNNYILNLFDNKLIDWFNEDRITEIESLGQILYTHYVLQFLIAGLILTLAVVGVVVLTIKFPPKYLATNVRQISRINKITSNMN